MELTGVTAQSIFDDNAADLKLSWVAGLEGADRAFDVDFAKEATSAADLVDQDPQGPKGLQESTRTGRAR